MDDSDEEIIRKIDELSRDPKKWDAYIASRIDKMLDNWPTRARRSQEELVKILVKLRKDVVRRAITTWERSQETFGDEIVALNDIDEALRNRRA